MEGLVEVAMVMAMVMAMVTVRVKATAQQVGLSLARELTLGIVFGLQAWRLPGSSVASRPLGAARSLY
jgi:hypothetical protein